MARARTKQCPACWSTIDLEAAQCPHCDAKLKQPHRAGIFIALAVLAITGTGLAAWWWQQPTGDADQPGTQSPRDNTRDPAKSDPGGSSPSRRREPATTAATRTTPHLVVFSKTKRRPVVLIALGDGNPNGQQHFCVPSIYLPTAQALVDEAGAEIPFSVITWDRPSDLVLLMGPLPTPRPEGFAPVATRDFRTITAGATLWALAAGTRTRQATTMPQVGQFEPKPTPGSVVLDDTGLGIAYATDRGGAPLYVLDGWRDRWDGMPLAELQTEIRAADPLAILADARKLLRASSVTVESATQAIEALRRGQPLARDRKTSEAFDQVIRFAHVQRVRMLSRESGVRALQLARTSLRELGSDPELLSDATQLALNHADVGDALAFYQSLIAVSPDHAKKIRDRVVGRLHDKATTHLNNKRNQAAADLLVEAVRNFPQRADLRMLYARALERLGRPYAAASEANEAARQDPSLAKAAHRIARAATPQAAGRVTIPMPRDASTVPTTGSIQGHTVGFVIDTGASYTTVPTAVARALGLLSKKNPRIRLTTASGVILTEQVILPVLTVAGKLTVKNVKAVAHDLPGNLQGKGLLGLNVLRLLNMRIDSKNEVLELSQGK